MNFSERLFSVTVLTTLSGAPEGILASISMVTVTSEPTKPTRVGHYLISYAVGVTADTS